MSILAQTHLVNQWKTPDGKILRSRNRHDYVSYTDSITHKTYAVDGGTAYIRIIGDAEDLTWCGVSIDDPIEEIREVFDWGSYGVNGDQPKRYILLKDMSDEHIQATLKTQRHILGTPIEEVFKRELNYRGIRCET